MEVAYAACPTRGLPHVCLDAIPLVLVSADIVSTSHGGTVGELDEEAIFYMQTRGLSRQDTVRVLVEGFFEPLFAELDNEPLAVVMRQKNAGKLEAASADIETLVVSR